MDHKHTACLYPASCLWTAPKTKRRRLAATIADGSDAAATGTVYFILTIASLLLSIVAHSKFLCTFPPEREEREVNARAKVEGVRTGGDVEARIGLACGRMQHAEAIGKRSARRPAIGIVARV